MFYLSAPLILGILTVKVTHPIDFCVVLKVINMQNKKGIHLFYNLLINAS